MSTRTSPLPGAEPAATAPRRIELGDLPLVSELAPAGGSSGGVAGYYDAKTASILRKYGPGPRVHFHIGCFRGRPDTGVGVDELRHRIRRAQQETVERAAEAWDAPRELAGRLLDAGCGLGGGAVHWARHCAAEVTAATIAPEHVPLVARFAAEAGVGGRVRPVLADACEVEAPEPFDAVVAMESACYFPRGRWFRHLGRIVRPGGVVCVEDTFLGREECREPFDRYWRTRVGPAAEYVRAAADAGFRLEGDVDLTAATAEFWVQSAAWSRRALEAGGVDDAEAMRLAASVRWHGYFHRVWLGRGIEVRLLKFRLCP